MEQNTPSVTAVINRMKTVLGIQLDKELSEKLGGSRGFVGVLKNRGTIPFEECVALALNKNISLDWLILGRGEKDFDAEPGNAIAPHLVAVPFLEGVGNVLEQETWYVVRAWLEQQGLLPDAVAAARVPGDAMVPTLLEGQITLLDLNTRLVDGVYLVRIGEAAHFRRIQHMADGSLRLICDNQAYASEIVPAAERDRLQIMGYCHSALRAVR